MDMILARFCFVDLDTLIFAQLSEHLSDILFDLSVYDLSPVFRCEYDMNLKDGGSVRYKALVYEVTKIHQLSPEVDGVKPYIDGFEIKILGMTVYRETNE